MGRITLLLGGARSGKSRRALELAETTTAERLVMIATAEAGDDEMAARIASHRQERAAKWLTIEEPIDLPGAVASVPNALDLAAPPNSASAVIVIDCLTLWLSNLMHKGVPLETATDNLCKALKASPFETVLISNEVGLGLVPETPLGREFRDAQGRLNQAAAGVADVVEFVAAGLPLRLKP
ncbi:MAG: bifunctional adenosylcobinamide kinase/adenosylcobinamide-phosphate guanylyltransferase [Filomicrobium sp.]